MANKLTLKMNERELVTFAEQCLHEAEGARTDRDAQIERNWELYNGQGSWLAEKRSWQSKMSMPHVPQAVETATTSLTRSLVGEQYWRCLSDDRDRPWLGTIFDKWGSYWIGKAKFPDSFEEGAKGACLMGEMCSRVQWVKEPRVPDGDRAILKALQGSPMTAVRKELLSHQPQLQIDYLDPRAVFSDPTGEEMYVIHEWEVDLHVLQQWSTDPQRRYRRDILEKLSTSSSSTRVGERQRASMDHNLAGMGGPRKRILLWEVYATIVDRKGNLVHPRAHFTVADGQHLLRYPVPITLRTTKFPIITAPMVRKPFATRAKGLIDDVASVAVGVSEMMNAIVDAARFAAVKAFAFKPSYLKRSGQMREGYYPGQMIEVNASAPDNAQPFWPLDVGNVPHDALAVVDRLKGELQSGTGVTDILRGLAASGGPRKTLGEVEQDLSQASHMLSQLAGNSEKRSIEPTFTLAIENAIRFQPRVFAQEILAGAGVDPADVDFVMSRPRTEVLDWFRERTTVECTGLTGGLQKRETLENIGAMLQMVGEGPMSQMINQKRLLDEIVRALGLSDKDFVMEGGGVEPELPEEEMPGAEQGLPATGTGGPLQMVQ